MLIVLGVLAGMAALAWPRVAGMLAKSQLQSAARQVRAAMARSRLDAMQSGVVQQFRCRPGTGQFQTGAVGEPKPGSIDAREFRSDEGATADSPGHWLPAGVTFQPVEPAAAPLAEPMAGDEGQWTAPILFFPNGRTSGARLQLAGRAGWSVELSLRNVTGTVATGKMYVAEESPLELPSADALPVRRSPTKSSATEDSP